MISKAVYTGNLTAPFEELRDEEIVHQELVRQVLVHQELVRRELDKLPPDDDIARDAFADDPVGH